MPTSADATEPRTDTRQADDARAFRHLLHEVASYVSGLGLTLEMLGEPGTPPEDTAAMVLTARGALDGLRHLIADVGELTRFLHRHGPLQAEVVEVQDLLGDLAQDGVAIRGDGSAAPPLPPVRADRSVIGFILHQAVKGCRRVPGVEVTASAARAGAGFVLVEVCAVYADQGGGRGALEKSPMVLDHYCNAVARDLGARFVREQSKTGQRAGFVLPVG